MGKQELDNLVKIGKLKAEPPSRAEYDGMLAAARTSLTDAQKDLDPDSKFTLAYGAAHPECLEWTDSCRTCLRSPDGRVGCSTPGIACQPKDIECKKEK